MEKWQLPNHWEWKTIPEICNLNPKRPRLQRDDNVLTSFVPMQAVDEYEGKITGMETRKYEEVKRGYTYFEENDILLAKITPSMENGKAAIAENLIDGFGFGTTEFHVFRPNEWILPEWIYYFIRRREFRVEAKSHFRGAVGQQRVPDDFLKSYEIPIPFPDDNARSLETQRRIVLRLESLLMEVKSARELQEKIEGDTGQLLLAFLKELDDQLSANYPKYSLAGNRNIAQIIAGQHIMSKYYSENREGTPYITGPADFGEKYPVITKWTTHPVVISQPGDVLFTVKGSGVGKVNCSPLDHSTCISRQIMAIRPNKEELETDFLYYTLLGRFNEFQDMRQGAAIPGIRKEQVENIEIAVPPRPKQQEVMSYINTVQNEISQMYVAQNESAELLTLTEQSLLAQAFRGEL